MRYYIHLLLFIIVVSLFQNGSAQSSSTLMGFTENHSRKHRLLEQQFDKGLHAQDMDKWMKRISAYPHHVGSPYDKRNALYLDSLFKQWGFQTRIDTYYVLFPTPRIRQLEMVLPKKYKAVLIEKVIPGDPYTAQTKLQLPPYNAYSADGDVTADLVYVNYGLPQDYKKLAEMGISVKGKIVIARYGYSWRGVKPKVAYEHGAIGCILYSDPKEDGYYQGDTYPEGAYKNPYGVQRGSVMDAPVRAGDPLTPGYAATKDAKRLSINEAETIMKIPVLPISYHDAKPLLAALKGPVVPPSWRGALPLTYHAGPGPAKVHLKLVFNWDIKPIYNVIAMIKGNEYTDQWIIRGNHHDAWVNGADDPVSGLVALMGEAKSMGQLVKQGWRPKRTIVYCAWDGEEPMLLGSTEWVEDRADELKQKAVAYINTDNNSRGFLSAGGSPTLEKFFSQVAFSVKDPEKGISVGQRKLDRLSPINGKRVSDFRLYALGTGSDYTPFLQHLGIASLNLGFGGEGGGGEYHTMYDNYTFFTRFNDPGFKYEVALAQVAGRAILRLADADILPFEFEHFYRNVKEYAEQVERLAKEMRKKTAFHNNMLKDKIYKNVKDPTKIFITSPTEKAVPYYNFRPIKKALDHLKQSVDNYSQVFKKWKENPDSVNMKLLNSMVYKCERYLTDPSGLPGQKWYKHLIYAPGLYTGYGAKTLPGIRQSIEERHDDMVEPQIKKASNALINYAQFIDKMIKETM